MEGIKGYRQKLILLFILSAIIFGVVSSFGVGMDPLSKELTKLSASTYELEKFMFFIGRLIAGLLYAAILLFIPSLIYWTISDEGEYRKLVVTQFIVLIILLIERLTYIPLSLFFSLEWFSSPLSLGVIAQYITSKEWVIYFFGCFSFFKIWIVYLQYKGVKKLTEQKNWLVWLVILTSNLLFWSITAFLAYLDLSTLF